MAEFQRVQVMLAANQRRALARIAKREGRSMSAILREMIEQALVERDRANRDWQSTLMQLREIRERNATYGVYEGDLVAEARAERTDQIESAWPLSS